MINTGSGQNSTSAPYPTELEEEIALPSGCVVTLRPIRPNDEADHLDLLHHLSREDSRWRFFATIKDMGHAEISRFTCIDYDTEMAFIATQSKPDGSTQTLGVVRTAILPGGDKAEFAIVVRSEDKHQGLGWAMMQKMFHYLEHRGVQRIIGEVMAGNHNMLAFAHDLGFESQFSPTDGVSKIWKDLSPSLPTDS